ncbi:MAG: DoxX family protein [Bacteroidota bacterium]
MENRAAGVFILRVLLGIIFLMQGYGKVIGFGMAALYENAFQAYESTFLPTFLIKGVAYFTSYAELIGGAMLILGLGRKWALYMLGLVLLMVSYGHGLQQPIWDLSHVFPRAMMLVSLLFLPENWDKWQLDRFLMKKESPV